MLYVYSICTLYCDYSFQFYYSKKKAEAKRVIAAIKRDAKEKARKEKACKRAAEKVVRDALLEEKRKAKEARASKITAGRKSKKEQARKSEEAIAATASKSRQSRPATTSVAPSDDDPDANLEQTTDLLILPESDTASHAPAAGGLDDISDSMPSADGAEASTSTHLSEVTFELPDIQARKRVPKKKLAENQRSR